MGKRGRPKTPTKILEARNSWRAKTRKGEPVPRCGPVTCDPNIGPRAKKLFTEFAEWIAGGIVKPCDSHVLSMACEAYATWIEAVIEMRKGGATSLTDKGSPCLSPMFYVARDARDSFFKFCREFGMTPASRANLSVENIDENAEAEKLLTFVG